MSGICSGTWIGHLFWVDSHIRVHMLRWSLAKIQLNKKVLSVKEIQWKKFSKRHSVKVFPQILLFKRRSGIFGCLTSTTSWRPFSRSTALPIDAFSFSLSMVSQTVQNNVGWAVHSAVVYEPKDRPLIGNYSGKLTFTKLTACKRNYVIRPWPMKISFMKIISRMLYEDIFTNVGFAELVGQLGA